MRQEGGHLCHPTRFWYSFIGGLPKRKEAQMKEKKIGKTRHFHHFTPNERIALLAYLMKGMSIPEIAKRIRKSPSTIYREITRGSVRKEGDGYMYGKGCQLLEYKYRICNQCPKHETGCNKDRIYYDVNKAEEEARLLRHESNKGPRIGIEKFQRIDSILDNLVRKGQSLEHIWHTQKEVQEVSCLTLRRWIANGYMKVKIINLRRAKRYKKAYKYRETKVDLSLNAKIKLGRTMQDYLSFVEEHPNHLLIQTDSVEGRKKDKRNLLTVMFVKSGLQLAKFYNKAASSIEVHSLLLIMMKSIGKRTSLPIVVLTDNGKEFAMITDLEKEVRDFHVFFADPYQSCDKAECERNHELLRYVIPKGYSLEGFTQEEVDEIMSNINSYARESLQWKKPVEIFRQAFGDELLQKWKIHEIDPSEVELRSKF